MSLSDSCFHAYKHDSMLTTVSIGRRGGRLLEFYTEGGYKDLLSAFFNMIRFCRFIIAAALCCSYMLFFILLRTTRHIPKAKGCWPIPVRWECVARDIFQPHTSLEKHSINDRFSSQRYIFIYLPFCANSCPYMK